MTAKERTLWEQAVRVLRQNSVTTTAAGTPKATREVATARERSCSAGTKPR
jgi:hypothetical protein